MSIHRRNSYVRNVKYKTAIIGLLAVISLFLILTATAREWRNQESNIKIVTSGHIITTHNEIVAMLKIPDSVAIHLIELLPLKILLEEHPFIKNAIVNTVPPATLYVNIQERTPFAYLLSHDGKRWLLDADGVVMPDTSNRNGKGLPVISGVFVTNSTIQERSRINSQDVINALEILRTAYAISVELFIQLSEIHIRSKSDIIMYTMDGSLPIIYGRPDKVTNKLVALHTFLQDENVCTEMSKLNYVDLRYNDQIVAHWNQVEKYQEEEADLPSSL